MKPFDEIRVLLIQARDDAEMVQQEQGCFLERCRMESHQLIAVNVVKDRLYAGLLDGADTLMVGGAGEYSATQDYTWMADLLGLVREAAARSLPTFGSCWGHQVIARALGGEVIYDGERAELGCLDVELTEAGQQDDLFSGFPARFQANMGHHDRVSVLPPAAVELAFNGSQRNQAFRIQGKPIYGTQFHSELDAERERERLLCYRPFYSEIGTEEEFQSILAGLADTTEVDHLLYDFLLTFVATPASEAA
ncbi:MAG: type 1 glutamine amidotransferase [Rhodothermales bacterium]